MKKLMLAVLFAICANVQADEATSWGEVSEIWSGYQDGMILFRLNISHINPGECSGTTWYAVDPSKTNSDKFLSLLLTAQSRKAQVQVMLSSTSCFSSRPSALRMGIKS